MTRTHLTVFSVLLLAACSEQPTSPDGAMGAAAKPGPSNPTATWSIPTGDASLGFASDGQYLSGGSSVYANGICGVSATIFSTSGSLTGDATIQTDKGARNCQRRFTLKNPDGSSQTVPSFANLNQLENGSVTIPVGSSALRRLIINPGTAPCGRIILGDNGTAGAGSDMVEVTRLSASSWDVHSRSGADVGLCENTGELYAMPVHYVISIP